MTDFSCPLCGGTQFIASPIEATETGDRELRATCQGCQRWVQVVDHRLPQKPTPDYRPDLPRGGYF